MTLPPTAAPGATWVMEDVAFLAPPPGQAGAASILLTSDDAVVLVDAGLTAEQRRALAPHVTVCLLTHCHPAHAKGASDFAEVWAPHDESPALRSLDAFLDTYGVARRDREIVAAAVQKAGYAPAPVKKRVRGGSVLRVGKREWHLIAAPGHSPAMIALHDPERHIVFAADLDGDGPPWYGWPTSDPSEMERTLTMLSDIPTALYLTSHGAPRKRGIKPMLRGMAETIRERDRQLLQAIEHPRSLDELADLGLFLGKPKSPDPLQRYHERVMVEKHLGRLFEKDFAHARQDGRFQRIA